MKNAEANAFLDDIAKKAVPATLRDHILIAFPDCDYAEFRSITTACRNRLRAGQSHSALLGTIIFPSIGSGRGMPAKWCGNVAPIQDTVAEPVWTESRSLMVISNALTNAGIKTANQAHNIAVISKMGSRALAASLSLVVQTADYADRAQAETRELRGRLQRMEQQMEEFRRMLGNIQGGPHSPIAAPVAKSKRSRNIPKPPRAATA